MNLRRQICTLFLILLLPAAQADFGSHDPLDDSGTSPRFAPRGEVYKRQRGNLQLSSVLAPGGAPYAGTQFTVLREEPDAFSKTRFSVMAAAGPHEHADFQLGPGRYVVQARNGTVTVEQPVEVPEDGTLSTQIVLDAGELHLGSVMDTSGLAADETWFRVLREDTDSYGRPIRVQVAGNGYGQTASFLLPAGDYIAEASYGDASVESPVRIKAGGTTSRELVLNAGKLDLFSTLSEGGEPLADTTFAIYRRQPGADAAWTEVTRAEQATAITFVLPEGEYRVRAQLDRAAVELPVRVVAGESQTLEMPLNAGELLVYATLAGQSDPLLDTWFKLEAEPRHDVRRDPTEASARGPAHSVRYVLPRGRYRAIAGLGESEGSMEVEIEPGTSQTVPIDLDAARVTLSLVPRQGSATYPYTWFSIYRIEQDGSGKEWRRRVYNDGFYPQTDVVLPAGNYLVFARSSENRGEAAFSLAPGEVKALPIVAGN